MVNDIHDNGLGVGVCACANAWGSDTPESQKLTTPLEGSQQVQRCNVAKREIIVTVLYSLWCKKATEQKIWVSLSKSKLLIGTLCEPCNNQLCATYTKNEKKKYRNFTVV